MNLHILKSKIKDILPANLIVLLLVLFFLFVLSASYAAASIDNQKENVINYDMYYDENLDSYDVVYAKTADVATFRVNESRNLRTPNARYFNQGTGSDYAWYYVGEDAMFFDRDSFNWFYVEYATTTQDIWNLEYDKYNFLNPVQELTYWQEILGRPVYALSTTTYIGTGDGTVYKSGTVFNDIHDSASGDAVTVGGSNECYGRTLWRSGTDYIDRMFSPVYIATTTSNWDISDIKFYFYLTTIHDSYNEEDYDYIVAVETNQNGETTLITGDYDECGESTASGWSNAHQTDIIEWSNQLDYDDMTGSAYNYLTLNSTAIADFPSNDWFHIGVRDGFDIEKVQPGSEQANGQCPSGYTANNASNKPYIQVTYTFQAGTSTPTASSTLIAGDYLFSNDIAIITAYTEIYTDSTTTPSQTRQTVIHVPAIIIFFLLSIIIPIISRIILEFIIRWRK